MSIRKIIATVFMLIALALGVIFFLDIQFPVGLEGYFERSYYSQYGPLAICVELLLAGYYLFRAKGKVNFVLALFAFTAIMDFTFDLFGLFDSSLPLYATVIFLVCAAVSLWIAFTNVFDLGRITFIRTIISFILGNAVELYFNYW